ncbi:MAG: hypothetical protein ACR2KP_08825 [Egibacteraceae bacterium]
MRTPAAALGVEQRTEEHVPGRARHRVGVRTGHPHAALVFTGATRV